MHPSLSVLVTSPSFYHSPLQQRLPMRTFSISISVLCPLYLYPTLSLFLFLFLCSYASLSHSCSLYLHSVISIPIYSPSSFLINSFRLFSSCIPFFVSPSRRNPVCLSRSCLLFLPLSFIALQFASTHTHVRDAYFQRVTCTRVDTHARTHARTYAYIGLMKSTNTSQYEWLVHASERDRVMRVHRVLWQI